MAVGALEPKSKYFAIAERVRTLDARTEPVLVSFDIGWPPLTPLVHQQVQIVEA
jgi:hypothetical protein